MMFFLFDLIFIADCFVFRYAVLVGNKKKKTTADGNNDKICLCVCVCVCVSAPLQHRDIGFYCACKDVHHVV